MQEDLTFDSSDLGETEEFLATAYAGIRIGGGGEEPRARIRRRWLGPISIDELSFGYDMSYDADPLRRVLLCRVRRGRIEQKIIGEPHDVFAPGDLTLVSPPELPHCGRACGAGYDLTGFDPEILDRIATSAPDDGGSVRLTGHRPVSPAAARRLGAYIDYLRDHVLSDPVASASQLIIGSATAHLAAATLDAFPNNAITDPTPADRRAAGKPDLLRRAMTYIDDYAHTDIALADIAGHVYVTPRALQYMFRQHLDCTPMEYLRRVRLHHAHRELTVSNRATATVTQIANSWGFAHVGRFATLYRQTYGRSPHTTLRD
jgi:AraC-like DNA-binding protein